MTHGVVNPVIIVGAPRAGTTILHHCLALHPELWHLPGESHAVLEGPFHPSLAGYNSNRVTKLAVSESLAAQLQNDFYKRSINLNRILSDPHSLFTSNRLSDRIFSKLLRFGLGQLSKSGKPPTIRLLEKTPKNALRVPMLERLFPDALYIWIQRNATANIDSLVAGWHAVDKFGPVSRERYAGAGYPIAEYLKLKDYHRKWWKFALVPQWRSLKGKNLADVAAWQYYQCNSYLRDDLSVLKNSQVFRLHYEEFVANPVANVNQILEWANLRPSSTVDKYAEALPRINESKPHPMHRSKIGLRYKNEVHAAIKKLPLLTDLQHSMGYNN